MASLIALPRFVPSGNDIKYEYEAFSGKNKTPLALYVSAVIGAYRPLAEYCAEERSETMPAVARLNRTLANLRKIKPKIGSEISFNFKLPLTRNCSAEAQSLSCSYLRLFVVI